MAPGVGCVLVADDVGRAVVLGCEEAVASVGSRPGGYGGRIRHVWEAADVEALVGDAVGDNVGDMAVSSDSGGREECSEYRSCLDAIHVVNERL